MTSPTMMTTDIILSSSARTATVNHRSMIALGKRSRAGQRAQLFIVGHLGISVGITHASNLTVRCTSVGVRPASLGLLFTGYGEAVR
jgi:hypothetical protein